jgi:trehalose 6-phosphate phosphatase
LTNLSSIEEALRVARNAVKHAPAGLFTDVDGTISPIVVNPDDAHVSEAVRIALRRLRSRIDSVGVVSGRSAVDARRMVRVAGINYIGNHGMERIAGRRTVVDSSIEPFIPIVQNCADRLRALEDHQGIDVENKRLSISVHYRNASDPSAARQSIYERIGACSECGPLEVEGGRKVLNLRPPVAVDKGTAILGIVEQRALQGAVYLGDDVTDVNAFRALQELRKHGVHTAAIAVRSSESPGALLDNADAVIDGVAGAVELLVRLSSE